MRRTVTQPKATDYRMLVGAPRADSGQKETSKAGALFACPLNTRLNVPLNHTETYCRYTNSGRGEWCEKLKSEYFKAEEYEKPPDKLGSQKFFATGKDLQLLGTSVASQAHENGTAVVRQGEKRKVTGVRASGSLP